MQNNIKGWFSQNLGAKIMAILFALFMWIYVMSVINPIINDSVNNISVELLNVEELENAGVVIKDEENHTVNIKVTGRSDQVYRLSREDFVATADLSGHGNVGANNVQVTVDVDADVEVEFSPRYIRVELEEVIRRQKNVDVNILGEPATGYVLGEPRITPSAIWIEGPESSVNAVESVIAALQLEQNSSDVVASLMLQAVDSSGNEVSGVRLESEVVEVVVPINRTKTVIVQPNLEIEAAEGYVVRNTRVTPRSIMIQGPESQLKKLTRIDTELIERRDLTENESIEVELMLPEGVSLYNDRTITVEIEISEMVGQEYELTSDEIELINFSEGLSINRVDLPAVFTLLLRGPEHIIENIDRQAIGVSLDFKDLEPGVHTLQLMIDGLNGLENQLMEVSIDPAEISIEVLSEDQENEETGSDGEETENEEDEGNNN